MGWCIIVKKACFKGFIFGIILSFVAALFFMLFAQLFAGGITSFWGESWLYFAVIVPFVLTFTVLGGYFHNRDVSNKKLWVISLISTFFVTLYSGTIGAIFGEIIVRGGIETINIEGTLIWGTIYAFIFFPFTAPVAKLLIDIFYEIIRNGKGMLKSLVSL